MLEKHLKSVTFSNLILICVKGESRASLYGFILPDVAEQCLC